MKTSMTLSDDSQHTSPHSDYPHTYTPSWIFHAPTLVFNYSTEHLAIEVETGEEVCFMFSQLKNRGFITGFITKNRGKTGSDF